MNSYEVFEIEANYRVGERLRQAQARRLLFTRRRRRGDAASLPTVDERLDGAPNVQPGCAAA